MTTLDPADLPYLRQALEAPASSLYTPAAGLAPEYDTVELLSAQFPNLALDELLVKLDTEARLDGRFFLCKQEQMVDTAKVLGQVGVCVDVWVGGWVGSLGEFRCCGLLLFLSVVPSSFALHLVLACLTACLPFVVGWLSLRANTPPPPWLHPLPPHPLSRTS